MTRLPAAALLLCAALAAPALAQEENVRPRKFPAETAAAGGKTETPRILRWMLRPIPRGMLIRLPIVDTDPNRGITMGVMPIWVLQEAGGARIEYIHAPSLTYNKYFGVTPTYRYYYYPSSDASLAARLSVGRYEHEAMGQYQDGSLAGTAFDFYGRLWYNIDASRRFFGVGPNSQKADETSYKEDYYMYKVALGHPLYPESRLRARLSSKVLAERVTNGPLTGIPGIERRFPSFVPLKHQQTHELGLALEYDTRDHDVTTTRGVYLEAYAGRSPQGFASSYDFSRYELDARYFHPWADKPTTTALSARYEQLVGEAPFWLLPSVGGKYSLRAYGEGRYVDHGAAVFNFEQRFKLYEAKMAGVVTEFEVAPFAGAGTVFNTPGASTWDTIRPVFGGAVRAVCRPQVVGSIDFGVGREGLAAFMDINYAF